MSSAKMMHVLIVDDDPLIHQSFRLTLPKHWRPVSATKPSEVPTDRSFHAAFVDLHLMPMSSQAIPDGLDVLQTLQEKLPNCELVAMSGEVRRDLMELSLKRGAQRFLAKPLYREEILLILDKVEALWNLREIVTTRAASSATWIGSSPQSQKILQQVAALSGETKPVLIEGESGTGKEVIAQMLHRQETDERPWVPVNLGSLPEQLFESEMFGSTKGSFTGADRDRIGLCEAADGGDLFLDEIEALPLSQQAKLLRFLESGEIRRVGSQKTVHVTCRVIAASNRPLRDLVAQGLFREDLLYRLSAHRLQLPPLRERPADIATLAQHFLSCERPRRNKTFAADGLKELERHSWPGNVRELKRICEQLSLACPLPLLRAEDVRQLIEPSASATNEKINLSKGLKELVEDFEKKILRQALSQDSDMENVAHNLGISRSNLYKKLKDYDLEKS